MSLRAHNVVPSSFLFPPRFPVNFESSRRRLAMIFKCERRRNRGDLRESVSLKGRRRSISDNQESKLGPDEEGRGIEERRGVWAPRSAKLFFYLSPDDICLKLPSLVSLFLLSRSNRAARALTVIKTKGPRNWKYAALSGLRCSMDVSIKEGKKKNGRRSRRIYYRN